MSARTRGAAALLTACLAALGLAAPAAGEDLPLEAVTTDVTITRISPQVLHPDETLQVVARVENRTTEVVEQPVVRLHVNRFRVTDRQGVGAWADLGPTDPAGSVVAVEVLEEPLPVGASREVRFEVAGRDLGFLDLPDTWGPRGLAVSVAESGAGGYADVDRSFVLWMTAPTVPRTRISVLVPLTGEPADAPAWAVAPDGEPRAEQTPVPPDEGASTSDGASHAAQASLAGGGAPVPTGVLGSEQIGGLVTDQGRLGAVLAATGSREHVAYAVDPALVAASQASPDEEVTAWAQSLRQVLDGRDVFALGWADPDVAALAHGTGAPLLEAALRLTTERAESLLGRQVRTDLAWPAGGLQDARTLELLASSGARAVVGSPEVLTPLDEEPGVTPTGRATVPTSAGSVVVLLPDPGLVSALVEPRGSSPATVAQRLLAETAVIAREPSTELRHLVVALPRGWHPDPQLAGAQLDALEAAPWVDTSDVTALLGALDPAFERSPLPTEADEPQRLGPKTVTRLAERYAFAEGFAPVLTEPRAFLDQQTAELLAPVSVAWRQDRAGRSELAARVLEDAEARTQGLSVVAGSDVSFFAREGLVPVTVDNALPVDARVLVELRPDSGVLVADEPVEATVAAGQQVTVRVPVQSVANGDVGIEVALLSPEGHLVAPTSTFTMRVRADWESVGTWVVAALLGIGLVAGIVRTVRRGKTHTRVDAADVPELARETGE